MSTARLLGSMLLSLSSAMVAAAQEPAAAALSDGNLSDGKAPVVVGDEALAIHRRGFVFDGHNDLPWELRTRADFNLQKFDISKRLDVMHTDIPRLKAGGVGAQFWSAYVPAETDRTGEALSQTLEQIDLIHRLVERYPDVFEIALTADDVERIERSGKIASLIGVEGGHSIQNSIGVLRQLYALGVRYMTLTHSDTLAWADSATDDPRHGGLSEFGAEVVREMNRLGMLVDISHVSAETMNDALDVSTAPVIASHSSAYAIAQHPRNVPDDVLRRIKDNGGVVMVNFFSGFVEPEAAKQMAGMFDMRRKLKAQFPSESDFNREYQKWALSLEMPRGTVRTIVDHIDHIVEVAGIDHVGLGSDYDGVTSLPEQLEDVSTYPVITQEMLNRGYSEAGIHKVMSANILRAMRGAEAAAKRLQ